MLSWIIQISLISIIFIFLVHHLIEYLKSTLTVPKVKDLVNAPSQKYKNIFDTISNREPYNMNSNMNSNMNNSNNTTTNINSLPIDVIGDIKYTEKDLLPSSVTNTDVSSSMKDELKNFLKDQLKSTKYDVSVSNLDDSKSNYAPF